MKSLNDIFIEGRSINDIISDLKSYDKELPSWSELNKMYDPMQHAIVADPTLRPSIKKKKGKIEKPAKIVYPAEKITTKRITQMAFTIPVRRKYNFHDDNEKVFADAVEKVYKSVRINGVNMLRFYSYFAACEMCTIWYLAEGEESDRYGFKDKGKLRCLNYSPMPYSMSEIKQADIYPYFDDFDDLIAISLEYKVKNGNNTTLCFDTYTSSKIYYFKKENDASEWVINEVDNKLNKINVIYISRPKPIYEDVDILRDEIEFTLSRNSDNIRKNSNPIIKVAGELIGEAPVGNDVREVYQMQAGGDIQQLAPALKTDDAIKFINALKSIIEEVTQLPDLSFENVKGLGVISGEARKTLLTDAHLKVGEEQHKIVWFLDREFEIIKAFLVLMHSEWQKYLHTLTCVHTLTPFIQNDKGATADVLVKTTGGAKIKSQRTAIEELNDVDNVDEEIERIREEEKFDAELNRSVNVLEGGL